MRLQSLPSVHWMAGGLCVLLLGLLSAGCATLGTRTQGEQGALTWEATDLHVQTVAIEKRETYTFTLLLRDTQGSPLTFTAIAARFQNSPGGPPVSWEKTGEWVLPARGELRLPLGSTRYCPYTLCHNLGELAPEWSIELTGSNAQGTVVRTVIRLRLPTLVAMASAR